MSEAPGKLNIPLNMEKPAGVTKSDTSHSQRAVSMGALSDLHHQSTAMELVGLQKWHKWILWVYLPLCVAIIVMSCMWADIVGKKGDYTNPDGSWQACLVNADFTYIPLNQTLTAVKVGISAARSNVATCIGIEYATGVCDLGCVGALINDCLSQLTPPQINAKDIMLPTGHFLDGFSYLGIEIIIFSAIAHATLHRGLRHPSWLLSTCALMSWFLCAIFTYYTVAPILPVPNGINSTLLSYLIYSSSYTKFDNFNNGNNHCHYALRVVWLYNILLLLVAFTVFVGIVIAIYAERIRYKSPNKPHYTHLKYTEAPVVFSVFAGLSYIFFIAAKITSSATELNAINNFDTPISQNGAGIWYNQIWFPFAVPTLDITTIVGICCVMSVLRGFTIQSLSAFRMALLCAIVYAVSIYPGLVGAYQFYDYNHFYEDTTCKEYFLGANTAVFGYPSDGQALAYCQSFRMSLIAITMMAFAMHGIAIACAVCIRYNITEGRNSLVHEVYDFDAATAFHDVASARSSFAANPDGSAPPAGPIVPKPLLSRANTNTGAPTTDSPGSPTVASVYTQNPLAGGKT